MEREHLDEQEAFTHLRRAARSSGRKLTEVAGEVPWACPCPAGGPIQRLRLRLQTQSRPTAPGQPRPEA